MKGNRGGVRRVLTRAESKAQAAALGMAIGAVLKGMERTGMTRADIARSMKTSSAYLTTALDGEHAMTVKTLASLAYAMGLEVEIAFRKRAPERPPRRRRPAAARRPPAPAAAPRARNAAPAARAPRRRRR
ncbi:MAG: hypothetical protein FJ034_06525 [Chloroflexi bacterium]|nr:hypothetical protein [Chloroflexota bacterium]